MKSNRGISTIGAALVAAVVAGGGGAAAAWLQHQSLVQARSELVAARTQMQTAQASANAARTQLDTVRKELDQQKAAFDQARAERDSAKALLEAEKQHGERIRAELTLAREQLAYVRNRQMPAYAAPRTVEPQILRVAPASTRPQAIGRGVPAAVQGQRASPPQ